MDDSATMAHAMAIEIARDVYLEDGVNVVSVYLLCIRDTLSELSVMV